MKAKQVYEFIQKKSLKNSIKDNIGVKYKIKQKIRNWITTYFEDNYKEGKDYKIINNTDLSVYFDIFIDKSHNNKHPFEKPTPFNNFTIEGYCYFNNVDKIYLPNKFINWGGDLSLKHIKMVYMPSYLYVEDTFYFEKIQIDKLPKIINAKTITLVENDWDFMSKFDFNIIDKRVNKIFLAKEYENELDIPQDLISKIDYV